MVRSVIARCSVMALALIMVTGCWLSATPEPPPPTRAEATPTREQRVEAAPSVTPIAATEATPTAVPSSFETVDGVRVHGYLGRVLSGPAGGAEDDRVQLSPADRVPLYGVQGGTPEIEQRLAEARDRDDAAGALNLYGVFECGVEEVNGCRLVVERVRLPGEQTDPEQVSGLAGRLVSLGGEAEYDDMLVLAGPLPVQIGVASAVFDNGYPMLAGILTNLRDNGEVVTLDGAIISGANDVNGVQLQVQAIYREGVVVDPLGDWQLFEDAALGLSLRYPPDARVEQDGGPFVTVSWDDVALVIGSRLADEDVSIIWGRTESLEPTGEVVLAGDPEPRLAWRVDSRLLGVRYGERGNIRDGAEIQRGDRRITVSLWQLGPNWFAQGDLTSEAVERAEIILSTLLLRDAAPLAVGMVNPASAYCEEHGGRLEIRTDAAGGQYGVCLFADGSECAEWAYFRGECGPNGDGVAEQPATPPSYVHGTLGVGLVAPPEWRIEEGEQHLMLWRETATGDYLLFIGARPEGANEPIFRTGMPEGEFVPGGQVRVFNYMLAREVLMHEGRAKVVAYGVARSGGLEFYCYLDALQQPGQTYGDLDIAAEVQAEADAIVASLAFVR